MHGLDEVAGTAGADVGHAGAVLHLGSHLADQGFDRVVGGFGAPRHHARTLQGPLGATGNPHANESEAPALQLLHATLGVGIEGIPPIDEQIALLQQGRQGGDHVVHRLTCLHHHQDAAGALQGRHEFGQGLSSDDLLTGPAAGKKLLGLGVGAIEHHAGEAVSLSIEDEVLPHHAETDQAEMRLTHGAGQKSVQPSVDRVAGFCRVEGILVRIRSHCHREWCRF